ncbi:hypothetical protein J9B83_07955 [Marinomonas sp. A79]|uniref:DUF3108 domain-containing protein n=1 Tax=Marinomonas vulgaris TaxID=2823372 RepID=A0ABS5HB44_9GAMM|nr:hypothetical protein [Marinomonas vulgaris]MBR7888878.1 hypothetical protein [Marinomonas vulgaris]
MTRIAECLLSHRFVGAAFGALLFSSISFAEAPSTTIIGSAYSQETGELLYRETHTPLANKTYKVEYSEPNGQVFAEKTLDFSESDITPSFVQRNDRNGERIEVSQRVGNLNVVYQENSAAKEEKKAIKREQGMVVDAGFDAFVKQYWSPLMSGKSLDVEYLVPSKQTTFGFRFSRATCLEGTPAGAQCFSLAPISWLVKMAVDPIVVAYDPVNKALLRFTGRANICDVNGKYENVDIQYRHL